MNMNRITPNNITSLKLNEVFVFGSNESGKHGRGAARTALKWGARWGKGVGLSGKTYGIPTKDGLIRRNLDVDEIKEYIDEFIEFAKNDKSRIYLVTEIGCGLAGLKPEQVAPLFKEATNVENIYLPERFWHILNKS